MWLKACLDRNGQSLRGHTLLLRKAFYDIFGERLVEAPCLTRMQCSAEYVRRCMLGLGHENRLKKSNRFMVMYLNVCVLSISNSAERNLVAFIAGKVQYNPGLLESHIMVSELVKRDLKAPERHYNISK